MAASEGQRIAAEIRSILVCCDIWEQAKPWRDYVGSQRSTDPEMIVLATRMAKHHICYWGEAAARIAEGEVPHE